MNPRLSALKSKVIDKTSDVLSAPKRAYYGYKGFKASNAAKVLKQANGLKNAPDWDMDNQPTDAFKIKTVANSIRDQYRKK